MTEKDVAEVMEEETTKDEEEEHPSITQLLRVRN